MLYQSCHIIKIPSSTRYHHQDISCDDGSIMRSFFAHVHLILKLFLKLTKFFTFTWLQKFVRLILFAVLLLPAFARVGYFYFTDKRIERGVRFGQSARNFLDIYGGTGSSSSSSSSSNEEEQLHNNNKNNNNNDEEEGKKKKTVEKKPIVIFITSLDNRSTTSSLYCLYLKIKWVLARRNRSTREPKRRRRRRNENYRSKIPAIYETSCF